MKTITMQISCKRLLKCARTWSRGITPKIKNKQISINILNHLKQIKECNEITMICDYI